MTTVNKIIPSFVFKDFQVTFKRTYIVTAKTEEEARQILENDMVFEQEQEDKINHILTSPEAFS